MIKELWSQVSLVVMSEQELHDQVVAEEERGSSDHVSRSNSLLQPPCATTPGLLSHGGHEFLSGKAINRCDEVPYLSDSEAEMEPNMIFLNHLVGWCLSSFSIVTRFFMLSHGSEWR